MEIKEIKKKTELDQELRSGGDRFMLFYSAWCPYCVDFMPDFEKAAAADPASFCKVSTDSLREAEDAFSIDVVPTVLFFRGGKLDKRLDGILYKGLTSKDLAEFVRSCLGKV